MEIKHDTYLNLQTHFHSSSSGFCFTRFWILKANHLEINFGSCLSTFLIHLCLLKPASTFLHFANVLACWITSWSRIGWICSTVFPVLVRLWSAFHWAPLSPESPHSIVLGWAVTHIPGGVQDLLGEAGDLNPCRLVGHGRQWPNFQMIPQL